MLKIEKILIPTDFSEQSKVAVPYALDMANRYDAELHVIHVFDEAALDPMFFSYSEKNAQEFFNEVEEGFEAEVESFLDIPGELDVNLYPVLANGNPFVEIIRYAKEQDMDMVIIGTHGRTGLSHMLLGSVAEKVIRKAHCPVLAVRSPDFEFEPPV